MLKAIIGRIQQGHRTISFPRSAPALPDRYRGLPVLNTSLCPHDCRACSEACPTGAIAMTDHTAKIDLGRCLFCTDCVEACPTDAITYTQDYRMAVRRRDDLVLTSGQAAMDVADPVTTHGSQLALARELDERSRRLFGRSLKLRQVSAGGCNACEADLNVLSTVVFDLGRFGVQFVASPRHADGLVITGPVTQNMKLALRKTYDAVPSPRIVIAVGACAISGGPYVGHAEQNDGADSILPVDLYIPGCPPHPMTILDGLLRLLGRLERDPYVAPAANAS